MQLDLRCVFAYINSNDEQNKTPWIQCLNLCTSIYGNKEDGGEGSLYCLEAKMTSWYHQARVNRVHLGRYYSFKWTKMDILVLLSASQVIVYQKVIVDLVCFFFFKASLSLSLFTFGAAKI
jgi:hypothetical protein